MALKQDNSSGYAALRHGAAIVEPYRSTLGAGRILLTGADRRSYLQGLLTNDIEALTPGTGCYAAMLTAQGRMMTDMRVLELGDAVLLERAARGHPGDPRPPRPFRLQRGRAGRRRDGVARRDRHLRPGAAGRPGQGGHRGRRARRRCSQSARVRIAGADAVLVRSDDPGIPGLDIIVDAAIAES